MSSTVAIDLNALARNLARVRRLAAGRPILAVLKADAYGHGAARIAAALAQYADVSFGVACVSEALCLREVAPCVSILLLYEPLLAGVKPALQHDIGLTITAPESLPGIVRMAESAQRTARVHLRVDTGFGPPGIPWFSAHAVARRVLDSRALRLEGLFTHFADPADAGRVREQLSNLETLVRELREDRITVPVVHAASTGTLLRYSETFLDMIRVGTLLYGQPRGPRGPLLDSFEGIMTWSTELTHIKDVAAHSQLGYGGSYTASSGLRVGVIAAGYADGVRTSPETPRGVLVRGRRVPILGRAMMDACFIDLTSVPEARLGDAVVLLGRQGREEILASQLAASLGLPTPEVWCSITGRTHRIYSSD